MTYVKGMDGKAEETKAGSILALDLGTETGWAMRGAGAFRGLIFSGVQSFPLSRGDSMGMRFLRFKSWLEEIVEKNKVGIVIYEASIGFHRSMYSGQIAHGFAGILQAIIAERQIECLAVTPTELKRAATGKGNSKKDVMLAAAQSAYPAIAVIDDNHADALLLLSFGEKTLRLK